MRAWSARSGRRFRSASHCARRVSISPVTISGASRPANRSAICSAARARSQIKLSWTIQSPTLAGAERQLEQGRALGYDSFNIKVGAPQTPAYDLELVRTVMTFAPHGFHWCDANTSYDLDTALTIAPKLADLGLRGLESPLPPNRIRAYQTLKRQGALPILMDEGIVSPVEVAEFIALEMFDGIAMKVARCGGLWNATRIAQAASGKRICCYLPQGSPILNYRWRRPRISSPGPGWIFPPRSTVRNTSLVAAPCDAAFRPRGDVMRVPTGPGLGIELPSEAQAR